MKKSFVVHPFLFAMYPVLYLYSKNIEQLSFYVTLLPGAILILATFVLLWLGKMAFVDKQKAALGVSGFFIWMFSYSAVRSLIIFEVAGLKLYRHRFFIVIWMLVLLVFLLIMLRFRVSSNVTKSFNVFASLLILFPLFSIAGRQFNKASLTRENIESKRNRSITIPLQADTLPDVYYIILDAYTGQKALKQYLNFDNSKFIQYLRDKGFYVSDKSHSNYAWTSLSIASTLNMDYLRTKPTKNTTEAIQLDDSVFEYEMIVHNKVVPFLESRGYKFIDMSIFDISISHMNLGSPKMISYDFNLSLLSMTILVRPLVGNYLMGKVKRNQTLKRFDDLRKVPDIKGPKFVYAHFLIPHHPYVFDQNGNMTLSMVTQIGSEKNLYIGQLIYANKEIEKTIESILSKSEVEPIIVIQGDHGAYQLATGDIANQKLRMSILNAYYLPSTCKRLFYDGITPVNTFRVMFNSCFGTDYALLPDEIYFSKAENIRHLINITGLVQE